MIESLTDLNAYLKKNFNATFGMGVGIHYGPAVIGQIGHPRQNAVHRHGRLGQHRVARRERDQGGRRLPPGLRVGLQGDRHLMETGVETELKLKGKDGIHRLFEVLTVKPDLDEMKTPEGQARAARRAPPRGSGHGATAPQFLRLEYHDAMTFDPKGVRSGADGSIRFPEELARPRTVAWPTL